MRSLEELYPDGVKKCAACEQTKSLSKFRDRENYKHSYCFDCERAKSGVKNPREKKPPVPNGMKWCPHCKSILDSNLFGLKATGEVQAYCKPCANEVAKSWQKRRVKSEIISPKDYSQDLFTILSHWKHS